MIPMFKVFNTDAALALVEKTLRSGYVGQGPRVEEFEEALSRRMGRSVLTTNSCTSALDLALHLVGVGPGDFVISTPQTCTATNGVVVNRRARLAWCDIDPRTGNIDPDAVGKTLETCKLYHGKPKAIIAVDWGGQPCDYAALRGYDLPIIEDAAHAFDTKIDGRHVAAAGGDYVCFSFQAIKHLNTGDGGALVVPQNQVERARLLRWYGLDRKSSQSFRCSQNIDDVGYKYHMNDIAASIGLGNLTSIDEILEMHRAHAKRYCEALDGVPGLGVPKYDPDGSWWIYSLRVRDPADFTQKMAARGIEVSPVHARNDKHTGFKRSSVSPSLPGVDEFSAHHVAIPVGWWLSDDDVTAVIAAVLESV